MMKIIIISSILLLLLSCEKENPIILSEDMLIGEWSEVQYIDSLTVLTKVRSLSGKEYGIRFNHDGTLTTIQNAGWCGTPPIAYGEFDGNWEFLNDSLIKINSTFWGGETLMEWKIISLDEQQMSYVIQKLEAVYKED